MRRRTHATARGNVLIYVVIAMGVFVGFASFGVDAGHAHVVKNELQGAADAAARQAAVGLATSVATAKSNAVATAGYNFADGTSVVVDPTNDIDFGTWSGGTFAVLSGAAQSNATAVRVTCRRTAARGNAVSLWFARVIGISTADVTASAICTETPGQPYGLVGLSSVTISNCTINSYSSTGSYAATAGNHAHIASNGDISVSGATVGGDAQPGVGGSFSGTRGDVSGSVSNLTTPLAYPTPSAGSYATTNDNANVAAYMSSGAFTLNGGTCNMPAGTYYFSSFKVMGGILNCTGPVTIYVTAAMQIASTVNTYQNIPANLQILGTGNATMQVTAGGTIYVDLYAPSAKVKILAAGTFYGALVGDTLQIMASATVHEDDALAFGTSAIKTVK